MLFIKIITNIIKIFVYIIIIIYVYIVYIIYIICIKLIKNFNYFKIHIIFLQLKFILYEYKNIIKHKKKNFKVFFICFCF